LHGFIIKTTGGSAAARGTGVALHACSVHPGKHDFLAHNPWVSNLFADKRMNRCRRTSD